MWQGLVYTVVINIVVEHALDIQEMKHIINEINEW